MKKKIIVLNNFGAVTMNNNSFPDGIFLMMSSLSGIYFVMCISKYMAKVEYLSDVKEKLAAKFLKKGKNND